MRLGDLDALKEDFKTRLEKAKRWKENALNNGDDEILIRATATIDFICEVIMTIDNAPTVSEITKEKLSIAYEQGYEDGKNNWLQEEKPQGEWIMDKEHTSNSLLWYKCNKCGIYHSPTNYCPHCGADMKGGAK